MQSRDQLFSKVNYQISLEIRYAAFLVLKKIA